MLPDKVTNNITRQTTKEDPMRLEIFLFTGRLYYRGPFQKILEKDHEIITWPSRLEKIFPVFSKK